MPGAKLKFGARRACLVVQVQLGAVVQAQHVVVVGAAPAPGDVQLRQQPGAAGQRGFQARRELADKVRKGLAHAPVPQRAVARNIGEHAQDAAPAHGRAAEGVDVQAAVVVAWGVSPTLDLLRPEAGAGLVQAGRVGRKQTLDQLAGDVGEAPHHRGQAPGVRVLHRAVGQRAATRVVA